MLIHWSSRLLKEKKALITGPDVLELQIRLKELGYYQGKEDGIFGSLTGQAVEKFQVASQLAVDGIVGAKTWKALDMNSSEYFNPEVYQGASIIIDIDRRLLIFVADIFMKIYTVAVGRPRLPTPLGNWTIVNKSIDPGGAFGARWMRLDIPWGGYGIHGTNNPSSIGKAVSHGCVRMQNEDVIEVYQRTPVGTPVTIIGRAYANRVMKLGDTGVDVKEVQIMLHKLKIYKSRRDGEYGSYTQKAVSQFQQNKGLAVDGMVGSDTLTALQNAYAAA